ncbi:MAG: type IIL restriction-modification enzyme MmeI, partial [Paracoccaceae bacterium]
HLSDPKTPLSLIFAIPDHPWVDAGDGAAVRIAMTVAEAGRANGRLGTVTEETKGAYEAEGRPVRFDVEKGKVFADLRIGADVAGAVALKANEKITFMGMKLHGAGFIVSEAEAKAFGLGTDQGLASIIRPYKNGRDLTQSARGLYAIDLYPLPAMEVRVRFPAIYQHVLDRVKPERDQNNEPWRKEHWWWFGRTHEDLRAVGSGLSRIIATTRTAKHRLFSFMNAGDIAESKIVVIGLADAWQLAVLSTRLHEVWALASGAFLEDRPNYNHTQCFNPFPFPDPTEAQKTHLRSLGEQLDAHRKAQQAAHPKLTLTAMYNVLEKLRAGERIEGKDKEIYDQGLIRILRDLHAQIDTAVAEAYGWPATLTDDEILHRLVDLNRERAAEESRGQIRWLRPDYQNPQGKAASAKGEQSAMDIGPAISTDKAPWPKTLPEQIAAVRNALADLGTATPEQIARHFQRGRAASVQPLLESLAALGQARPVTGGRFAA